jgi:hypothetical protein
MSAKDLWAKRQSSRAGPLRRARECAALTLPGLMPPEGTGDAVDLPTPYQSLGARGVNNLSSKMLLTQLPAGTAFFRLRIAEAVKQQLGAVSTGDVEKKLAELEREAMFAIEGSTIRPHLAEACAHLVVTGNCMLFVPTLDKARVYTLDQYVIQRDAAGNPVRAVVKETVHPATLSEELLKECQVTDQDKQLDLYTVVEWKRGRVKYWQECNGIVIATSRGDEPVEKSPWMPLRWRAVPGRDYGRGLVEEYLGDLKSLEGLSQAIVEFSAVAAKIVFLVHPNSSTDMSDVNNAESGDAVAGSKADIDVLQLDKFADFQVAEMVIKRLEQRLSYAFLLRAGVTREAERVTAEEIRAMAQELEDVLGGVYTVLSQELQLPLVRRVLAVMQREGKMPNLPKGAVSPVIVTGFEALGRNYTLNRLRSFVGDVVNTLGPDTVRRVFNESELVKRLGVGHGVESLDDLIKSAEQMTAESEAANQQGMANEMISKAAGPMAAAAAGNMAE